MTLGQDGNENAGVFRSVAVMERGYYVIGRSVSRGERHVGHQGTQVEINQGTMDETDQGNDDDRSQWSI
jgi:hypothetical protein